MIISSEFIAQIGVDDSLLNVKRLPPLWQLLFLHLVLIALRVQIDEFDEIVIELVFAKERIGRAADSVNDVFRCLRIEQKITGPRLVVEFVEKITLGNHVHHFFVVLSLGFL